MGKQTVSATATENLQVSKTLLSYDPDVFPDFAVTHAYGGTPNRQQRKLPGSHCVEDVDSVCASLTQEAHDQRLLLQIMRSR